jgi:large subunit ribosomal protein L22
MSARKARLVMDAVRGRVALEATTLLQFVNKRAAPAVKKLIESAVANAEEYGNRNGIDIETDNLIVAEARADEGPRMKRWRPRSRGMANPFTRYTCHLFVMLAEAATIEERAAGRPAWRKPRRRLSREERLIKVGRMEPKAAEEKKSEPRAQATAKATTEAKATETAKPEKKAEKPAKKEAKAEKKPAKKAEATKSEKKAEKKPAKKDSKDSKKKK